MSLIRPLWNVGTLERWNVRTLHHIHNRALGAPEEERAGAESVHGVK